MTDKESQSFFRDDFHPTHNGRKIIQVNFPKTIYGEPVKRFVPEGQNEIEIIQMDSGITYYRHLTYAKESPYGWNYLHHHFRFNQGTKPLLSHEQFEDFNYNISKHLLQIKILKLNKMFKDLAIEITDFKIRYLALLYKAGIDLTVFKKDLL